MPYSMWVFSSDNIDGPYSPLVEGFRLSGASRGGSGHYGWLAAWCGPSCDGAGAGAAPPPCPPRPALGRRDRSPAHTRWPAAPAAAHACNLLLRRLVSHCVALQAASR